MDHRREIHHLLIHHANFLFRIGMKEICNLIETNLATLREEQTEQRNSSSDGDELLAQSVAILRHVKVKLGMVQ